MADEARTSPMFRMADRLADGNLRDELERHLRTRASFDAITRRLFADFGIEVTRQTVSKWCHDLGLLEQAS